MAKNRFKVQQNLEGVRAQLKEAVNRVDALYENVNSTLEERREAENIVKDLKNRAQKYENDLKELDAEAEERLNSGKEIDPKNKIVSAKASLIRATMNGERASREVLNTLGDGTGSTLGNGKVLLPQTLLTGLVAEPYAKMDDPTALKLENGLPTSYTRIVSGKSTAYTAGYGARTASGRLAEIGTVAVNPNVIPYGSELYIVAQDGSRVYGYAIAADTGLGLMDGTVLVDLYFGNRAEHYYDSCAWGAVNVDIYVLSEGSGR